MPRRAAVKSQLPTRERILDAAIFRFSRQSYETTGLRDIAADAEVDVAYVHRCFGSKKQLFGEAVQALIRPEEILDTAGGDVANRLAAQIFVHDDARHRNEISPFDIVNHSLSSVEARDVLRDFITKEILPLIAANLPTSNPTRNACFVVAYLTGMGILRNVIDVEPLRDEPGGWLDAFSKKIITAMLKDDPDVPS